MTFGLLTLSVWLGLAMSTRLLGPRRQKALFGWHQTLVWTALAMVGLHGLAVLLDPVMHFGPASVLVPFVAAWKPIGVAAGVTAGFRHRPEGPHGADRRGTGGRPRHLAEPRADPPAPDGSAATAGPRGRLVPYALPVQGELLEWFGEHGRDLPWRGTRDPYAILVSEVMLQQTQAARVVPRYLDWLERWPSVEALAAAPAAEVIRAWQGLGYNRRALNLQRTARAVVAGGWPDDLTELPGVGPYTAAAVACFALGRPVLPVDVNVQRVLERTGLAFGPECAQALMDLGATVCIARVPRCGECPLAAGCPSRGRRYEPLRKQGPFEGSFRQRRASALRSVLEGRDPRDREAVAALAADGLVRIENGIVSPPV